MKLRYMPIIGCIMTSLAMSGCFDPEKVESPIKSSSIYNRTGDKIGTIRLSENLTGGVNIVVDATDIPEGDHGIGLYEKADCSSDNFSSVGESINPEGKKHGLNHPEGPRPGNMPNAIAGEDNVLSYAMINKRVSMYGEGGLPALFDQDGSALIIHKYADDQKTQPNGGAGPKIACAIIGGPDGKSDT